MPVFSSPSFKQNNMLDNFKNIEDFINNNDYKKYGFNFNYYKKHYKDVKKLDLKNALNHYLIQGRYEGRHCNKFGFFYGMNTVYKTKGWKQHPKFNPEKQRNLFSLFTRDYLNNKTNSEVAFRNSMSCVGVEQHYVLDNSFVFITPSYNNEKYYERNLNSVLNQTYKKWRMIYIDDASTDKTHDLVTKYIEKHNLKDKITLIRHSKNMKQAYGRYHAFQKTKDNEIICFLDGDDWLYDNNVLGKINTEYQTSDIKITCGSYVKYENESQEKKLFTVPRIPNDLIKNNLFRKNQNRWYSIHLRTGYASIYKKIPETHYKDNNNQWISAETDRVEFTFAIEQVKFKYKILPYPTYVYNIDASKEYDNSVFNLSSEQKTYRMAIRNKIANENYNFNSILENYNIKQVYISSALKHFGDRIKTVYNLKNYNNINAPVLIFGLYFDKDLIIVQKHKGNIIIVPGGSDIEQKIIKSIKQLLINKIVFIAISENIYSRLRNYNIRLILCDDFSLLDNNIFYPRKKSGSSKKIYVYDGYDKKYIKHNTVTYGKNHIDSIVKMCENKYDFIFSSDLNQIPNKNMPEIYEQCFIGLRLTNNDGNANTVQEFEAMNIPIVHNQSEYGLKWKTIDDIINHIKDNTFTNNILTIDNFDCINIENIYSYQELSKITRGDTINEYNFLRNIQKKKTLYVNNKFIRGNSKLTPQITISRNKKYNELINKNNTFASSIPYKKEFDGLCFITNSMIEAIQNKNSLLYPHVYGKELFNELNSKKIFLQEQKIDKNWYNWATDDEIKQLKLKYFPEDAFVICICGRIAINSYPKSLLEAIKILRNQGHNIHLLALTKFEVNPYRLTQELYDEITSYKWVKSFTVDKKDVLNYFRMCDILASTYRDYCNHVGGSNKIKEYLLCNKPILCSRGKERENELGKDYFGFYDCKTCDTVPPLCWTQEFLEYPYYYTKQYKTYFKDIDNTPTNKQSMSKEINDILIIIKYYYINKNEYVNDIGIITIYDWCNTGFRYSRALKENNIKCEMIKLFPTPCFDYGLEPFAITNTNNSSYYGEMQMANAPCFKFHIFNKKVIKLLETFIKKCKYIYFHAESLITLENINFFNKFIICGASGHPLRRQPKEFCEVFNPISDGTLIQCPDLLNLGTKNEKLVYYGVDHNLLHNIKTTNDKLIIGHFSSNPTTKGSDTINKCIDAIIKKYPNRFDNFFKEKIDYTKNEQHNANWSSHTQRYKQCDIYIETCKTHLNAYSSFVEYNNTPFGEWGNTCLEAAASGCIVITNSLTKNYYLQEYEYDYPILIANNESEIMKQLEYLYSLSNNEIQTLKSKFLEWVRDKHSIQKTGERFSDVFLTNLNSNIYPSYLKFKNSSIKFNENNKQIFSFVYLTNNKENNINFSFDNLHLPNWISVKTELIISTIDLSFIRKITLQDLQQNNISTLDNLFTSVSVEVYNNSIIFKLKLKTFSSNLLIYFKNNLFYHNDLHITNNSENNLFLRNINNSITIDNRQLLEKINANDFQYLLSKPCFNTLIENENDFNTDEEKKIYIIDKYIDEHI